MCQSQLFIINQARMSALRNYKWSYVIVCGGITMIRGWVTETRGMSSAGTWWSHHNISATLHSHDTPVLLAPNYNQILLKTQLHSAVQFRNNAKLSVLWLSTMEAHAIKKSLYVIFCNSGKGVKVQGEDLDRPMTGLSLCPIWRGRIHQESLWL